MKEFFNQIFWSNALSNAFGTLMAAIISTIFVYWIIKPFRNWLHKQNSKLADFLQWVSYKIMDPYLRLTGFIISITALYIQDEMRWLWLTLSFIIFMTFFSKEKKYYPISSPSSIFSDNFQSSKNKINP